VRMENTFYTKGGTNYTYVAFSPENETKVRESLQNEMDRLRKSGVTADELKKSIAYTIGEHEIGMQTRFDSVLEYARAVFSGEGVQGVGSYGRLVRNVTADQVKKAAETYLDPKLLRVAIVRGKTK